MTSHAMHSLEKPKISATLSLQMLAIGHKGTTKIFSHMMGAFLFLQYLGEATVDMSFANSTPETYTLTLVMYSLYTWLFCSVCVYWVTEFIPNGGNWKNASEGYTNRDFIKLFFIAMKHNILVVYNAIMRLFGIKRKEHDLPSANETITENQNVQATEIALSNSRETSTESQYAQVTDTAPQGMALGSFVIKGMIGIQIVSWVALLPHNIYISMTEKYRTPWFTDILVGKKSISQLMSEFGSEHILSIVMMLFFGYLNYYVVQQAKMLLDGDEDCMNPHNMDKLSAFLRIFIATSIHVGLWYYMATTKYAHFFM